MTMTAAQEQTVTPIRQADDTETQLSAVYPLRDLNRLDDDQEAALTAATRDAMRPLVEQEWASEGYEVAWSQEWAVGNEGRLDPDPDRNQDLSDLEVSVWSVAYGRLDTDAIWAQVVGA